MRIKTIAAAGCLASGLMTGLAVAAPSLDGGRYQLAPAEGGFLRLDRETGATAFCETTGEGYACRPVAEEGQPSTDRVAELEKKIAEIEKRLKTPGAAPSPSSGPTADLPTDEQVDRVTGFIERAVKRLRRMAEELQKEDEQPADRQRL